MTANDNLAIFPGQRVLTTAGAVRTVAFIAEGAVWVYAPGALVVEPAVVVSDAWGGECDLAAPTTSPHRRHAA